MTGRLGELLVILAIIFVFFGAGKLPQVMGQLGKGVRALRKGVTSSEETSPQDEEK